MIHISLEGKEPDKEWLDKAKKLTKELKKATPDKRKEIIENNQSVWRELKEWLKSLSHGKCWYSEAKEIFSLYDVDHFRPKNRVKDLAGQEREGYWWLAFDWQNYRLSGVIGNRLNKHVPNDNTSKTQGKSDYFPLRSDSNIASNPADNLEREIYYLLDPTNSKDPLLISFDETGLPVATNEEGSWEAERVKITVHLLHLDYVELVEARKKLWIDCRTMIDNVQKLLIVLDNLSNEKRDKKDLDELKIVVKNISRQLLDKVSSQSELAGTARACLLKSGIDWAKDIVESAK